MHKTFDPVVTRRGVGVRMLLVEVGNPRSTDGEHARCNVRSTVKQSLNQAYRIHMYREVAQVLGQPSSVSLRLDERSSYKKVIGRQARQAR
jgi:hypothetical protein